MLTKVILDLVRNLDWNHFKLLFTVLQINNQIMQLKLCIKILE